MASLFIVIVFVFGVGDGMDVRVYVSFVWSWSPFLLVKTTRIFLLSLTHTYIWITHSCQFHLLACSYQFVYKHIESCFSHPPLIYSLYVVFIIIIMIRDFCILQVSMELFTFAPTPLSNVQDVSLEVKKLFVTSLRALHLWR